MSLKRWMVLGCVASMWLVAGCETDSAPTEDGGAEGDGGFDVDAAIDEVDANLMPEVDAGTDSAIPEEDAGSDAGEDAGTDAGEDAGTDAGDAAVPQGDLEIVGRWHSSYGGTEVITADAFNTMSVADYDNDDNVVYTQNPSDAQYGADKFNKIVWTEITDGSFFYCYVDFSLDTLELAKASTATADDSDPENSGCGSFPWTKLSPAIEIEGRWHSNYGGTEVIDSDTYGSATVAEYDNDTNVFYSQNPPDALYGPNKFNKIVWTEITDGSFFYCYVDFSLDTLELAKASTATADDSDPENSGCGSFPWTKLSPAIEIEGRWHSNYGGTEVIDSDFYNGTSVAEYDNDANVFYNQNLPDALYGPNKFNKIVWTEIKGGSFYYCYVAFSLDTLQDAKASTATADGTDPENSGCGGFPWTRLSPVIEIEGRWHNSAGGTEVIDSDVFSFGGADSAVIEYDNATNVMYTQNPDDDGPTELLFNKVVWTESASGSFYYCVVDSGLDTFALAKASTMTADATDPETGGCAGQPWQKLGPVIAVEGGWTDGITPFSIDSDTWGLMSIVSYTATSAITQNDVGAQTDPSLFNKVVWTGYDGDSFYFCFVSLGEQSAADAETNAGASTPGDLVNGCVGGAWTEVHAN